MIDPKGAAPNAYELTARVNKAARILAQLDQDDVTSREAERFTLQDWIDYAKLARVHTPSEETRRVILYVLSNRERKSA